MAQSGTIPMVSFCLLLLTVFGSSYVVSERQAKLGNLWVPGTEFHWCTFYTRLTDACSKDQQCGRAGFCNKDKRCQCHPPCTGLTSTNRVTGKAVKCTKWSSSNDAICGQRGICEPRKGMDMSNPDYTKQLVDLVCICYPNDTWDHVPGPQ